MGFVEAVKSFYGRYFDFQTRSSRSEYWWYVLFAVIVSIVLMIPLFGSIVAAASNMDVNSDPLAIYSGFFSIVGLPFLLFSLINIIPCIAIAVRRLHDHNKSGWFYLLVIVLSAIPLIGLIVSIGWLVFMCMRGTVGENRFGPDPLGGGYGETFS